MENTEINTTVILDDNQLVILNKEQSLVYNSYTNKRKMALKKLTKNQLLNKLDDVIDFDKRLKEYLIHEKQSN